MKVVLINGSPHKEGCTYMALREVADTLETNGIETEIIHVAGTPVAGCTACGTCRKTGKCVVDDQVNELIERLPEIDGSVFGSPVYYSSASGQICSVLDRLFFAAGRKMAEKPGAAVVSCRRGGSMAAFDRLNKYFTISSIPVVSSQYWNHVHGNTPEEVRRDEEGMQVMRTLGRNMAWILKCIELGRKNGVNIPERETPIATNFIR